MCNMYNTQFGNQSLPNFSNNVAITKLISCLPSTLVDSLLYSLNGHNSKLNSFHISHPLQSIAFITHCMTITQFISCLPSTPVITLHISSNVYHSVHFMSAIHFSHYITYFFKYPSLRSFHICHPLQSLL